MKKIALIFVVAVLGPSLVLAWLAIRSLRDQELVFKHQQSLLYQQIADAKAKEINSQLDDLQKEFAAQVDALVANTPEQAAPGFDDRLRKTWPLAEIGFVVSVNGDIASPSLFSGPEARQFRLENDRFLCCSESVEVYWNALQNAPSRGKVLLENNLPAKNSLAEMPIGQTNLPEVNSKAEVRCVVPLQTTLTQQKPAGDEASSKVSATPAEFCQLIGNAYQGTVARFLQNQLRLLFWRRAGRLANATGGATPSELMIFGAQINLKQLVDRLQACARLEPALAQQICVAFLDDKARPVALSEPSFSTNWRHPFVASEIGETLPHWEVAVYLLNPARLDRSVDTTRTTLAALISLLVVTIGAGGWFIVHCLNQELKLARQKTDFVSNVSHELKTPLTSIRMFSELLADGKVTDREKHKSYLGIITAETARLSRLINNVLDFARMERGEMKYRFDNCDLTSLARATAENFRPHLEANGFSLKFESPSKQIRVRVDHDAISQVLVNLLSNAEKYSNGAKQIILQVVALDQVAELRVLDRGTGVPAGSEEKIFEQFYRAHDSLSSGIQGSGLGLTLARQIARAHGGDLSYQPREGGGSCFALRLPLAEAASPSGGGVS